MPRQGNNPKRRIAPLGTMGDDLIRTLVDAVTYVGSGHHKRHPADYGLERVSPRPTKSLCDLVRTVTFTEAYALLLEGVQLGMVSDHRFGDYPKFVWAVDGHGEVYEAKTDPWNPGAYHGYRLEEDDDMRSRVERE